MSRGGEFLEELRKRGVVRAGLLYAAGAFALLEFADIAFPRLGLPDGAVNVVLWLGLAGFPLALLASWAIEIRAEPDSRESRSWLSPTTLATSALLVAVGVGMGLLWGRGETAAPAITRPTPATTGARGPAVAVLRLADLTGSADYGYFAAGLSEEISTALSRFPGIRVISPNATPYFDEADEDLARIDDLGVRYLLRGSVRRDDAHARISVQLLETSTGSQIWGESYDVELAPSELFATQERIARRVASTIGDTTGVLAGLGQTEARRRGTHSLEAYDCVLLAQSYFKVHTAETHARARECLERAVEIDPDYAEAWAHLAYVYREEFRHGYDPGPDPLGRALAAAKRAIALDGFSSMAHYSLSVVLIDQHQFESAVAAAERALALNPNDSLLASALSIYLAHAGRWERALDLTREVEKLNPLHNSWIHLTRSMDHYRKGEFEQALSEASKYQGGSYGSILLAASYGQLGRKAEARAALQKLLDGDPGFAADPSGRLRHLFYQEVAVQRYLEGLRLAGLELEELH